MIQELITSNNLKCYYDFRQKHITDISNNNVLTITGTPRWELKGLRTYDSTSYLSSSVNSFSSSEGTIFLLLRQNSQGIGDIFCNSSVDATNNITLNVGSGDSDYSFIIQCGGVSNECHFFPGTSVVLDKDYYLTVVYNSTYIRCYVDGIMVEEITPVTITTNFWGTAVKVNGDSVNKFDGYCGIFGYIDRDLSDDEVILLYNELSSSVQNTNIIKYCFGDTSINTIEKDLISGWNKIEGKYLIDVKGANNGLVGEVISNIPKPVVGALRKMGDAVRFGGNGFVNCGQSCGDYTDNFTLSTWLYIEGTFSSPMCIFSRRDLAGNQYEFIIDTPGQLNFYDNAGNHTSTYSTSVRGNTLLHIGVSVNGANSKIYINGKQNGATFTASVLSYPTIYFLMGAFYRTGGGTHFLKGFLIAPKLHNIAKDANWFAEEYLMGRYLTGFDYGISESISNETSGYISNSPFIINSGTWKIVSKRVNGILVKVLKCISSGVVYVPTQALNMDYVAESSWGGWEMTIKQGNAANTPRIYFISNTANTSGNGYAYEITAADKKVRLYRITGGATNTLFVSASAITTGNYYKFKLTRDSSTGNFYVCMNNILLPAGSGSNPVVDLNYTSSSYIVLSLGTDDEILLCSNYEFYFSKCLTC